MKMSLASSRSFVEIVGDRFVGIVQAVIGAAMHEFKRVSLRRGADGDFAMRRIFRRLGDRNGGLELKAGVVGRGEDGHRLAVDLRPSLSTYALSFFNAVGDGLEGVVPSAGAFEEHDRLGGQRRIFAERVAWLAGAAGRRTCPPGRSGGVSAGFAPTTVAPLQKPAAAARPTQSAKRAASRFSRLAPVTAPLSISPGSF